MPMLLALLAVASAPVGAGQPADVRALLAGTPPAQVVDVLTRSGGWGRFLSIVASGDPDAISLVPQLSRGASGGALRQMVVAMADALPRSPAAVLANLDPTHGNPLSAGGVCGSVHADDPDDVRSAWTRDARGAVDAVYHGDPSLQSPGEDCLAAIGEITPGS